jgi:hypothetical protein
VPGADLVAEPQAATLLEAFANLDLWCVVGVASKAHFIASQSGVRGPRFFEQFFRIDKWSVCRG